HCPIFTLFPYTPLFRSVRQRRPDRLPAIDGGARDPPLWRPPAARLVPPPERAHRMGAPRAAQQRAGRRRGTGPGLPEHHLPPLRSEEHTSELQSRENLV